VTVRALLTAAGIGVKGESSPSQTALSKLQAEMFAISALAGAPSDDPDPQFVHNLGILFDSMANRLEPVIELTEAAQELGLQDEPRTRK
jgi:hypothetical protein